MSERKSEIMNKKIKRKVKLVLQISMFFCFRHLFSILPLKIAFSLIVLVRVISRRVAFFLTRVFMLTASKKLNSDKNYKFSFNLFSQLLPLQTADILIRLSLFHEAIYVLEKCRWVFKSYRVALLVSQAYFEIADFVKAREALSLYQEQTYMNATAYTSGLIYLLFDDPAADNYLLFAANYLSIGWCPHQNIAARYPAVYQPHQIDYDAGVNGLMFDAYNYLAQRVTHVGRGDIGIELYAKAFAIQKKLLQSEVILSSELKKLLNITNIKELRILSWEWLTQIGHLGMLDVLFRMKALGWWSGKVVILYPEETGSANDVITSLFQDEALILRSDINASQPIIDELFSLQRYCGLSFNAWEYPNGTVIPWQQAGARAMREWDEQQRQLPLLKSFDKQYDNSIVLQTQVDQIRKKWGMKPNDWYVCLHMRDAAFYGEMAGTGQTHRNAEMESYLKAIQYITERGGWVIKLGGKKSELLPKMDRVVDYACSHFKSALLDAYFLRYARFFIGTTSGLTNIAISFGIPCALVNCITVDSQLWNNKVRFALKRIKLSDGRFLTQRELTSSPWRWRLFAAEVLRLHHASIVNNTEDEILEVVKEVDALSCQSSPFYLKNYPHANELIQRWGNSLSIPEFYGNGLPSLYYLAKYENIFLDQVVGKEASISVS